MTKEEMLLRYSPDYNVKNYAEAQRRIAKAMQEGLDFVYLPGKFNADHFNWVATEETIERLRNDGFDIDNRWNPIEYWSIEW